MIKPSILFFDLELSPTLLAGWPRTGKTHISYDQILEDSKIIMISYKWAKKKGTALLTWDKHQNDAAMVKEFQQIANSADILIGHNSMSFDTRHIMTRLCDHQLPPLNVYNAEDTYKAVKKKLALPSYKLDYLVKRFGLGRKMHMSGWDSWIKVWWENNQKELARMQKYCKLDTILLEKLYYRVYDYIDHPVSLSTFNEDIRLCPSCGGKLRRNGFRPYKKGWYQGYLCTSCFKTCRSGKNQLTDSSNYPR